MASSGAITQTRMAWKIGSSDATTDNSATGTDIIIALEETVAFVRELKLTLLFQQCIELMKVLEQKLVVSRTHF